MKLVLKESSVALFWVIIIAITLFVHCTPFGLDVPDFRYVGY